MLVRACAAEECQLARCKEVQEGSSYGYLYLVPGPIQVWH